MPLITFTLVEVPPSREMGDRPHFFDHITPEYDGYCLCACSDCMRSDGWCKCKECPCKKEEEDEQGSQPSPEGSDQ